MEVGIKTPSRLHFGLIDLNGSLGRIDGGSGVALEHPCWKISATASETLSVEGPHANQVIEYANRFVEKLSCDVHPQFTTLSAIPSHVGLGSQTQLALAVGKLISHLNNHNPSIREMAVYMGRGGTSGIGTSVFESGKFVVDLGHSYGADREKKKFLPSRKSPAPPPPTLFKRSLPHDWKFVVSLPDTAQGAHGIREVEIFQKYCPIPEKEVEKISRLVFLQLIPSVMETDLEQFGSSLSSLQNLGFKKIEIDLQHPVVRDLLTRACEEGASGAGMSSFGPVVFAVTHGVKSAETIAEALKEELEGIGGEVWITEANNEGARTLEST